MGSSNQKKIRFGFGRKAPRKLAAGNLKNALNVAHQPEGSFQILSIIGHGWHCTVYKARRLLPNGDPGKEILALKVLNQGLKDPQQAIANFKREAVAMLSSKHENVIHLNDFVSTGNQCYILMEYAGRGDLRQELIRRGEPFDYAVAVSLMIQVLKGLQAIHRAGIIHRDIKPENLLLTEKGIVKIADFGIAQIPTGTDELGLNSRGVGTCDYLAPECLERGMTGISNDIYSAGVTLYQLLTSHLPFEGEALAEVIENKLAGVRAPLSRYMNDVPRGLEELVDRALHPDYTRRFRSAADFRRALEMFLAGTWEPHSLRGKLDEKIVLFENVRRGSEGHFSSKDRAFRLSTEGPPRAPISEVFVKKGDVKLVSGSKKRKRILPGLFTGSTPDA